MKVEKISLEKIRENRANPRQISDAKFSKLITSVLVLPKMLDLRPIVVDKDNVALGGNMRLKALQEISVFSEEELAQKFSQSSDYKKRSKKEQDELLQYWLSWKDDPVVTIVRADNLSGAEQKEFIIKDNVGFGQWDWDELANNWDEAELSEWGLDVWNKDGGEDFGDLSMIEHEIEDPNLTKTEKIVVELQENEEKSEILSLIQEALKDFKCTIR